MPLLREIISTGLRIEQAFCTIRGMDVTTVKPFLSVADLATRLGVSRRTAYNLVNDRAVPVVEIRGLKKVPVAALDRWLADREAEALAAVRREAAAP
jgi:excisionase family DNA binding protein